MLLRENIKFYLSKSLRVFFIVGIVSVLILEILYISLQKDNVPSIKSSHYYTQGTIAIESTDHQKRNTSGNKPFSKFEGDVFGLTEHNNFAALEFLTFAASIFHGRGIASGDFNNDGWQDIVIATNRGIIIYKNLGNYSFSPQDIKIQGIPSLDFGVHVVAFVDINNDGWQDIYITVYGGKNYFLLNDKKGFKNLTVLEAPDTEALVTMAVSFGDLDKDGSLDFVNGNWLPLPFPSEIGAETNKLIMNKNLEFTAENLQGIRGQTLSTLFSDFNNDNNVDLIDGDEFERPDNFYIGNGEGSLKEIKKSDGVIPISSNFTMSIDVADFNNDLYADIYIAAESSMKSFGENPCSHAQDVTAQQMCEKNSSIINVVRKEDLEECATLTENRDRNDCMVLVTLHLAATSVSDESICSGVPSEYQMQELMCHQYFLSLGKGWENHEKAEDSIRQLPRGNVLLQGSKTGAFSNVADDTGSTEGLFSWNAKFADLDNDEWQDIYVATGFFPDNMISEWAPDSIIQPNVFFHNQRGQYFNTEQSSFGLEDFGVTSTYTYIDIDNDGDLDIVSAGINSSMKVYINNETQNNSITFEFRDNKGNHLGIGNKVYIFYGENNEKHQVREIKLGGGFASFDAPIAHFGLGKYETINKVEIVWSTGEKTVMEKEFLANKNYVISRGR